MKKIKSMIVDSNCITIVINGEPISFEWDGSEFIKHDRKKELLEMERIVTAFERGFITNEAFIVAKRGILK